MSSTGTVLLRVESLSTYFGPPTRPARAVQEVSFEIRAGQTVALVGESGCGKSATALSLARLLPQPPAFYAGGRVLFMERDLMQVDDAELRAVRGGKLAYIFQEPAGSLNPVFRVREQIAEVLKLHRPDADLRTEIPRLMESVGIPNAEARMHAYPHELSGGLQQRVMIAMALAGAPKLLIADEPTTALDVTIQKQILDLLRSLQRQTGLGILLITHNLGLVAEHADVVHVMYAGRIVESGTVTRVLQNPRHPYTRALLRAVPRLTDQPEDLCGIDGMVPRLRELPSGCAFHPRCPLANEMCRQTLPMWESLAESDGVRCHRWQVESMSGGDGRG